MVTYMIRESINDVYEGIINCVACMEIEPRFRFAPACHGQGRRGIMIVGLCPSRASVEAGRFYNQGSMRTLTNGILDIDLDCFLSDVIKCDTAYTTATNVNHQELAMRCGNLYLRREIAYLKPNVIVAVGKEAFAFLTEIEGGFVQRQGDGIEYHERCSNIPVFPIIHPSYGEVHYRRIAQQRGQSYTENVRSILSMVVQQYGRLLEI